MYSTCLFCNQPLGTNETFESFPIGRRLAFDAARGRLWVVCRKCERWNLTPLEERWEAIEQAERLYRDTRRRVATEEIGLAKLNDGTELVRIGRPLRPEFAAWRYGDQFGRRRRRNMFFAGAGLAAVGGVIVGAQIAGITVAFGWMSSQVVRAAIYGGAETVVARVPTPAGQVLAVRRRHLAESALSRGAGGQLALDLRYKNGESHFEGHEAMRIASLVVPAVNRFGGSRETVANAVEHIESGGGPEAYLARLARSAEISTKVPVHRRGRGRRGSIGKTGLYGLDKVDRLALEMALHEEAERRALEGELALLEQAWKNAEEIAAIADDMFLPGSVTESIEKMRKS